MSTDNSTPGCPGCRSLQRALTAVQGEAARLRARVCDADPGCGKCVLCSRLRQIWEMDNRLCDVKADAGRFMAERDEALDLLRGVAAALKADPEALHQLPEVAAWIDRRWKDTEAARDAAQGEVVALRALIEGAPHGDYCVQRRSYFASCDCWKAKVLAAGGVPLNPVGSTEGTDA